MRSRANVSSALLRTHHLALGVSRRRCPAPSTQPQPSSSSLLLPPPAGASRCKRGVHARQATRKRLAECALITQGVGGAFGLGEEQRSRAVSLFNSAHLLKCRGRCLL